MRPAQAQGRPEVADNPVGPDTLAADMADKVGSPAADMDTRQVAPVVAAAVQIAVHLAASLEAAGRQRAFDARCSRSSNI